MSCEELRDHYELFAMGLLDDPAAHTEIDAHLARRCPACTKGVRDAAEAFSLVALTAPAVDPPAALRERVLAAVRAGRGAKVVAMPVQGKPAPAWRKALPWAAAAALLVGLGYYRQAEQARTEELVSVRVALQHMENARKLEQAELDRLRPLADFLRQALAV